MTTLNKQGPDHYRFREVYDEHGVYIILQVFVAIAETPCGYWVVPESTWRSAPAWGKHADERLKSKRRFVRKGSAARWCSPDKAVAFYSYKRRKRSQAGHAQMALAIAELAHSSATRILDQQPEDIDKIGTQFDTGIHIGRPEYFSRLNWDC